MKKIIILVLFLMSLTIHAALKPPIEANIAEIESEFDLNPARAKKVYSQQPVIVEITVKEIKENPFAPIIYIYDSNSDFVLDVPEAKYTDEILALNPGDSITVVATPYDKTMGSIYVKFIKIYE